ncbi:MAG: hypothetical protein ABR98_06860 [Cryomorphaceae bacterium BACL7 MAG-120910-bin2]|jgi:predicted 3-demethylubiquinone-9 3-methyltransferase (glyoxalase superfamily)|nr:MAG: hypothetical protein ABR98_06860 [Cryomorphaceae bacterium BACL7 MAG-120910-bin2]KRO68041.1 MAG: hypothetical protein ABR88_02740 [Cryomorphaceae bacterium BACL7 MAG-120322-bin74]KRO81909.1 MAG: hypothetical protein ABR87_00585 [Cryomorphaceae bacterium BACL7 MAG-121220-bin83]NQW26019.1 VOC family protein [Cryomorphaceae bacterium]
MSTQLSTCFWIQGSAQEAVAYYCQLIPGAKAGNASRSVGSFQLPSGHAFLVIGDAEALPTVAHSLAITCDTQKEVDQLWEAFLQEGKAAQCGWLQDRYGFSWQIIPKGLQTWLNHPQFGPENMERMRGMIKLDAEAFLK